MAKKTKRTEMSGLMDFFRKKPGQRSIFDFLSPEQDPSLHALPAPKKPGLPAIPPEGGSLLDFFQPSSQVPAAPQGPERPSIFSIIPRGEDPTTPPPPPQPMVPWQEMFTEEHEPEPPPISEMFRKMAREQQPSPRYVFVTPSAPPEVTPPRPYGLPAPSSAPMTWQMPTVPQLAQHFEQSMNLPAMWDEIRRVRSSPNFRKDQLIASFQGLPMIVEIDPIVYQETYTDFANFYGIPWAVMDSYLSTGSTTQEKKQSEDLLWKRVLSPLNAMLPDAFHILKPGDIPGWFTVSFDDRSGEYWLYYVEPRLEPPPQVPVGGFGGA